MQKSYPIVIVLAAAACLAGTICFSGCRSGQAQVSEDVLGAVDRAQRLYERAFAMLESPVVTRDGQLVGATELRETDVLDFAPRGAIHPDALPTLDEAAKGIDAALKAHRGDVSDVDRALAQVVLGRIAALKAYCHTAGVAEALDELAAARRQADDTLATARVQADLLGYYRTLGPLGKAQLDEMRSAAQQVVESRQGELAQMDQRAAELQQEQVRQAEVFEDFSAQARTLRVEGRLEPGLAGLDKLEQGLELQAKADAAELASAQIEYDLESLAQRRKVTQVDLNAAQQRVAAMDEILAERRPQQVAIEASAAATRAQVEASQQTLVGYLDAMAARCRGLAAAQADAQAAYEQAATQFEQAGRGRVLPDGTAAQHADVLMASGDLAACVLRAQQANETIAAQAAVLWEATGAQAPAAASTLASCVGDSETFRSDAAAKYRQAATLYETAMRSADARQRWAYQGQVAVAYMRLYELTGEQEAYAAARSALAEALEGRQYSRHLQNIADLQEMLEESVQE